MFAKVLFRIFRYGTISLPLLELGLTKNEPLYVVSAAPAFPTTYHAPNSDLNTIPHQVPTLALSVP